jgi:hypothetical protein
VGQAFHPKCRSAEFIYHIINLLARFKPFLGGMKTTGKRTPASELAENRNSGGRGWFEQRSGLTEFGALLIVDLTFVHCFHRVGFAAGWIALWIVFGHADPRLIVTVGAVR